MTFSSRSLFLALGLSLAAASQGQAQTPQAAAEAVAPARPVGDAEQALFAAGRLPFAQVDRLYADAVLSGDLEMLQARLTARASGADPADAMRARLIHSVLHWRDGDLAAAMADVDAALQAGETLDALLLKGRLLDVQGEAATAADWYGRALALSTDAEERALLQRRIAVIGAMGAEPDALTAWAATDRGARAERGATVLALLGRFGEAVALQAEGASGADYADQVRLADWAIASGDRTTAVEAAWKGHEAAATVDDRRYALALLVEAFRADGALAGAETFLAARRGPEVTQARLDVLLELGRYDEAASVARGAGETGQARLLQVLRAAGRNAEVEQEYRRLLREQPNDPRWPEQLAGFYLQQDQTDEAAAVYGAFFRTHRARPDLLVQAARRMMAMGLQDQALELLRDAAADPALAAALQRLEIEAAIDQGRTEDAEAALAALRNRHASDRTILVETAEDYERLGREDLALETLRAADALPGGLGEDQQSHLADLALETGDASGALDRWLKLWDDNRTPARKSYLQRRIVLAAQRLNRLEEVATGLEARLTAGTARPGDVELLVEIRIIQANGDAVARAVEAYATAGGGDRERLEQLASVYARLRMNTELNATLEQLAQRDPSNADAYLRRLIVNVLRWPTPGESEEARNARVDALLARLQAAGGLDDAEAARFAASIYASGYRQAEALAQYQRGLALAPTDVDALQQLASALKGQGQVEKALALLQYRAEIATNDAAFLTALNGVLDMTAPGDAGGDDNAPSAEVVRTRLAWTRQALLERILGAGDPGPLTALLSEVAQSGDDDALEIRALRLSVADVGEQKPAVLRQLVSLTAPTAGRTRSAAEMEANAAYGRRLVALRRPYPPEVYRDIARGLLEAGDRAGAGRAFALMEDMGGLVNIDALRGGAYAAAGYLPEARDSYRLALLRDRDDLDLMADAGVLMEQMGERTGADQLYWRAVNRLIQRQPLRLGDDGASLDTARLAPTLVEGLLLNWPEGDDAERRAQWRETVEAVLAQPAPIGAGRAQLASQPRLALAVAINRRLAIALQDPSLAALEAPLAARFRRDEAYQRELETFRGVGGFRAPDAAESDLAATGPAGLGAQATATGNDGLATALAFSRVDRPAIRRLFGRAIGAEAAYRSAREQGGGYQEPPTGVLTLMLKGADAAPDEVLRDDLLNTLDQTPFVEKTLFDLLRIDPAGFDRYEVAAGRRLLENRAITQLLVSQGNESPAVPSRGASLGAWLENRLGRQGVLSLYGALVTWAEQGGSVSRYQADILGVLLDSPLDEAQIATLQPLVMRDLATQGTYLGGLTPALLKPDAPVANRPLLLLSAEAAAKASPALARLPDVLRATWGNDPASARDALTALGADLDAAGANREAVDALLGDAAPLRDGVSPGRTGGSSGTPLGTGSPLQALLDADSAPEGALRRLWRGSAPTSEEATALTDRLALVSAISTRGTADEGLDVLLTRNAPITDEIEAYLAASPPAARQNWAGLYDRVAEGLVAQGRAEARWTALNSALSASEAGGFDDHDVGLWLALQSRLSAPVQPDLLRALGVRTALAPVMSADRRLRLGALFGRFGDPATGTALLEAALLQGLYPRDAQAGDSVSLQALLEAADDWSDRRAAEAAQARLRTVLQQQATAPGWAEVGGDVGAGRGGQAMSGQGLSRGTASRLSSGP